MSEINKRIEALEAELQKLKNEVKPKFEVGKWYKLKESTGNAIACYQGIKSGFGISGEMWFNNDNWTFPDEPENWIPATHQEVKKALIEEAKKKGFKEGVYTDGKIGSTPIVKMDIFNEWNYSHNILELYGCCIFRDGVWAEIVKDEPIKVGGYSVEKIGESYRVGCKRFEITDFIDAKRLIEKAGVKSLRFESIEINIETINKILAL